MAALAGIGGEERYWVHIPARRPRAYKNGGLVAAARAVKGSPMANDLGDSELIHVNKYEMEQLREMWGDPAINPETGLPAYGLFKVLKKVVKGVAKIGATIALTPVLGPVGAAAAVNAVDTAISGGNLGDIVKSAAVGAATAGGAQLGGKYLPGLTGVSAEAGRAIGAGIAGAGVTAAQGGNLTESLLGGVTTGLGTFAGNRVIGKAVDANFLGAGDAYNYLTNVGKDISNFTGIGGPPGGYTSRMDIKPVDGAPDVINYGKNVTNIPGSDLPTGDITVTARPGTNLVFGSGGYKFDTSGKGLGSLDETVQREDYTGTPEDIVVTGKGTDLNLTLGDLAGVDKGSKIDLINADITQDEAGTIYVNGTPASEIDFGTINVDLNNDGKIDKKDDEIIVNAKEDTKVVVDDTIFDPDAAGGEGLRTQVYPTPTATQTEVTVPLTPTGGTFAQRTMNRGLANIGFNPFTYGQAIEGGQPGEFLFFTENGAPFGNVGTYTGPTTTTGGGATTGGSTTGGGTTTGGTTTGGTTTGGTPPGGTPGSTTQVRPAGYTGVISGQKIGDTQVVDGKTYVWGGFDKGWQWLATDNNGNQVLMPGNGATNVSSNIGRPATPEEQARLAEIDRIMAATKAAPTAAAARAINPAGVYFDIDAATAAAIGKPELVGTQMSMRDLREAKMAADEAARARTAAQIPTQIAAAQAAPTPGMTARSYYMDYVTPLASSYYSTGKLDAAKARALQQAVEPFVGANDLAGAQNAVNSYLSAAGLTGPAMAEGGEVEGDDMMSHLISYRKNGGHMGPGRVKGIGSGQEDKIPAWLSDGEYVWSAQDVADLGDGSTDEGVRRLDKMRQMVRKQAGRKDVKKIAKPQRGIDKMLKAVGGAV